MFPTSIVPSGRTGLRKATVSQVPKDAPIQSFFRCWDFGHATMPLGNFGPSLGTPYAAAFPRPTVLRAIGGDDGWMVFGCASVPDAAMTLDIRSSSGCLNYRYREDLWGASLDISATGKAVALIMAVRSVGCLQCPFQYLRISPRLTRIISLANGTPGANIASTSSRLAA